MVQPKSDFLFEISYEVASPYGGIYTVLSTKAEEMVKAYGENYFTVGPYHERYASKLFVEEECEFKSVVDSLKEKGIIVYCGRWLVSGNPKAFLIDYSIRLNQLDKIKSNYKKKYNIDAISVKDSLVNSDLSDPDLDVTDINLKLAWGDSTRIFLNTILKDKAFSSRNGVLHFHSTDPSYAVMADLNGSKRPGFVVTAHSTKIGRTLSSMSEDLYSIVDEGLKSKKKFKKGDEYSYGSLAALSQQIGLLAAKHADVFTAVSDITAREVEYIYGRKVDVVTPNGLNTKAYPGLDEQEKINVSNKRKLSRFLDSYFKPYFTVDSFKAPVFLISGRYQFHNKGYDVFIDGLGELNNKLKSANGREVFALIMVYEQQQNPVNKEVEENLSSTKKNRKGHKAPLCVLDVGISDLVVSRLRLNGLLNRKEDKVKVIYYPLTVSPGDGFINLSYTDVISASDVGVFLSYYEPWGYTPQETAASGLLSVTSDLAGFGVYARDVLKADAKNGIYVLPRRGKPIAEINSNLASIMMDITLLSHDELVFRKRAAKDLISQTDWSRFIEHYITAHNLALKKKK